MDLLTTFLESYCCRASPHPHPPSNNFPLQELILTLPRVFIKSTLYYSFYQYALYIYCLQLLATLTRFWKKKVVRKKSWHHICNLLFFSTEADLSNRLHTSVSSSSSSHSNAFRNLDLIPSGPDNLLQFPSPINYKCYSSDTSIWDSSSEESSGRKRLQHAQLTLQSSRMKRNSLTSTFAFLPFSNAFFTPGSQSIWKRFY